MAAKSDQFVLFVDMLGFSALTEQFPPLIPPGGYVRRRYRTPQTDVEATLLSRRFERFHKTITARLVENLNMYPELPHTNIVFSDCAFVVFGSYWGTSHYAVRLMRDLILQRVPCRMGIASGSFNLVRHSTNTDDHTVVYATQFLGSAVSRAHAAEHAGLKGMRIALHSSVGQALVPNPYSSPWPMLEYDGAPTLIGELNYASVPGDKSAHHLSSVPFDQLDSDLLLAIKAMRDDAPTSQAHHYDDTLNVFQLMQRQAAALTK